jgi:hypothetical protein
MRRSTGLLLLAGAFVLLSAATLPSAALAEDNCAEVKAGLTKEWGVLQWGLFDCYSGSIAAAEADASGACFTLYLDKKIYGVPGRRTVNLWLGGPETGTFPLGVSYIGYCYANKSGVTLPDPNMLRSQAKGILDKKK